MKAYLDVIRVIEDELTAHPFVNTVTYGDIFDMDLSKQTIFPLAHYIVGTVSYEPQILVIPITLSIAQISDTENHNYALAECMTVAIKLLEVISRGDLRDERYHLRGVPQLEPFLERGEHDLYGWNVSFQVEVPNQMGNDTEQSS